MNIAIQTGLEVEMVQRSNITELLLSNYSLVLLYLSFMSIREGGDLIFGGFGASIKSTSVT